MVKWSSGRRWCHDCQISVDWLLPDLVRTRFCPLHEDSEVFNHHNRHIAITILTIIINIIIISPPSYSSSSTSLSTSSSGLLQKILAPPLPKPIPAYWNSLIVSGKNAKTQGRLILIRKFDRFYHLVILSSSFRIKEGFQIFAIAKDGAIPILYRYSFSNLVQTELLLNLTKLNNLT